MAYGKKPSGIAYDAFKAFVVAGFAAQKPLFLPKGTPKDIVDTYTTAINKVVNAPDFKTRAGAEIGEYIQATGPAAAKMMDVALSIDPEAKKWVKNWLVTKFNAKLDGGK
jgi:hypothetical protein